MVGMDQMANKEIVTSFRVDEDLWKEARIYAIENGMTMKQLIENILRKEVAKGKSKRDR